VKVFVFVPPLAVADTFTVVLALTWLVTTVKFALELPWVTVTVDGMEATALAPLTMAKVTTVSWTTDTGRKPTVAVVLFPPVTELGLKVRDEGTGGSTVKKAFLVAPFAVAEILTWVEAETTLVAIVQLAELNPACVITDAGIEATAAPPLSTARETVVSVATGALNVTVALVVPPPRSELGDTVRDTG
jgi:hypothetical protein